ncbi:MAG: CotH kinase family protein [Clostridiales bacterium]|nr:CotH kinase family protein [Clostridiales bacterium]
MLENKHVMRIIVILTSVLVILSIAAIIFSEELILYFGGKNVNMEYETRLFDTSEVMRVNILMDEDKWDKMLKNATDELYYSCDVVVNGQKFKNVGIRPKGNSSLWAIYSDHTTDRYSLKLEFDQFEEGQTCFGLDKLILNNNYGDATNMKEALIYDMFQFLGADASLYNFAKVSVNGDYRGVYLALEAVEDSFMLRNYGTQDGELYKPDRADQDLAADAAVSEIVSFFDNQAGCDLNYSDDDLKSYHSIWDCEITRTGKRDHRRVVEALKHISEGNNLEKYMDVDNIIKYMSVHVFAINKDSFSADMPHNYYLYEYKGRLNILPWDYNLSFGGMDSTSPLQSLNDPIDNPFHGTHFFDKLLENEDYHARYYECLRKLTEEYFGGGKFDEAYNRIRGQIDQLVATDPTAFYTNSRYLEAADMLYRCILIRAESIKGQLNGSIPSTTSGQAKAPKTRLETPDIDFEVMGLLGDGNFEEYPEGYDMEGQEPQLPEEAMAEDPEAIRKLTLKNNIIIFSVSLGVTVVSLIGVAILRKKN